MRPSIGDIRRAVADVIGGIEGVQVAATVNDSVNPPAVVIDVADDGIEYQQVYRTASADIMLRLVVLASRVDARSGQETLDELITPEGPRSIPQALLEADTLGGLVDYVVPTRLKKYGAFGGGAVAYLGAELEVEVHI